MEKSNQKFSVKDIIQYPTKLSEDLKNYPSYMAWRGEAGLGKARQGFLT